MCPRSLTQRERRNAIRSGDSPDAGDQTKQQQRRATRAQRRAPPAFPEAGARTAVGPASATRRPPGGLPRCVRRQRVPRAVVRPGPVLRGRSVRAGRHRLRGVCPDWITVPHRGGVRPDLPAAGARRPGPVGPGRPGPAPATDDHPGPHPGRAGGPDGAARPAVRRVVLVVLQHRPARHAVLVGPVGAAARGAAGREVPAGHRDRRRPRRSSRPCPPRAGCARSRSPSPGCWPRRAWAS